jgi:hypothetical protein
VITRSQPRDFADLFTPSVSSPVELEDSVSLVCRPRAGLPQHPITSIANGVNRAPIEEGATEAIYEVRVTPKSENLDEVRELFA